MRPTRLAKAHSRTTSRTASAPSPADVAAVSTGSLTLPRLSTTSRASAPTDATAAAVAALAREVVLNRGKVSDSALAAATAAGLSAEAVLEIVLECAFASLVGLIDNIAGHVELDAILVPQAWSPEDQQH